MFIDRDDSLLRGTTRRVEPNTSAPALSLMTGMEDWAYDDDGRKVTRRTRSGAWSDMDPDWLIDELRSSDSLGRLHSEAFGFGEDGASGHQSKTTKTIGYGYAHGSSGDDTGFRRSMSFGSGWDFELDPDGAGKQKEMRLKGCWP